MNGCFCGYDCVVAKDGEESQCTKKFVEYRRHERYISYERTDIFVLENDPKCSTLKKMANILPKTLSYLSRQTSK